MSHRDDAARQQLHRGLEPASRELRARHVRSAVRRVLAHVLRRAPLLAAVLVVVTSVASVLSPVPLWLPATVAVLLLGALCGVTALRAARGAVRPLDAALACDRAHETRDRLSAALDLASQPAAAAAPLAESLACAAIADGVATLARVDAHRVTVAACDEALAWGRGGVALAALVLCTWLLGVRSGAGDDAGAAARAAAGESARGAGPSRAVAAASEARAGAPSVPPTPRGVTENARAAGERRAGDPPGVPGDPQPAVPAAPGAGAAGSEAAMSQSPAGLPKAAPAGAPGSGRPGGGSGQAAASAAQPTPEVRKESAAVAKGRKPQAQRPLGDQEPKPSESAGAPSGPSRGSGRTAPVGNKRQDLSRGQEREEDPEVADEPIEDETDEQEQRGGVMPMRRQDQRPPARELSISGDGPPDQGRGGPTPPKKSRGTASLVLGLRLPDQIRGQPNPGTAKTSIEQIPPRRQDQDPGLAHAASGTRTGTVQRARGAATELDRILAAYHARLRADEIAPAASRPADPNR